MQVRTLPTFVRVLRRFEHASVHTWRVLQRFQHSIVHITQGLRRVYWRLRSWARPLLFDNVLSETA